MLGTELRRNAFWFTALTGFQRIFSMVQTILIARALGITEYGVYGLLFGTIGFVASVMGLQMGLTATVFIARYREYEKEKASAVIQICSRFGWMVSIGLLIVAVPFVSSIGIYLLSSSGYEFAVLLALIFIVISIVSGIQDGIAQGFEQFAILAKVNVVSALLVLAVITPAASGFGLNGVLLTILIGVVLKFIVLQWEIQRIRKKDAIPRVGSGVSFGNLIGQFALPSMLVSLGLGAVTWLGMFMLSRQAAGFNGVAIANTGLQWRGPVLLLTSAIGTVAIPAFSRLSGAGDVKTSLRLRRKLALLSMLVSGSVGFIVMVASGLIMSVYGKEFLSGRVAFSLIVLSSVPMVIANVYMQELVGKGEMWRQLWLHIPFLLIMALSFFLLIPHYFTVGYAVSLMVGGIVLLISVVVSDLFKPAASSRISS